MKPALTIGVAFLFIMPLFISFSTATPTQKTIHETIRETPASQTSNGTVTLTIKKGFNYNGFLSRIGYSINVDNTHGTKTVNYSYTGTFHYINHDAYDKINSSLIHGSGLKDDVLFIPFPMYPFKITLTIQTDTSTNLSLTRTGIMLFNCYVLFTSGNETATGPS